MRTARRAAGGAGIYHIHAVQRADGRDSGLSVEGGGLEFEDVLEFAVLYMQQELKEGKNLLQLED